MADPPEIILIDRVFVAKVEYPIYDHFKNPSEVFYSTDESLLYSYDSKKPVIVPAAVTKDAKFRVELSSTALALALPNLSPPYTLTAQWDEWEIFSSKDKATPLDLVKDLVLQPPTVQGVAKTLPWQVVTSVEWTLKCSDPKKPIYTTHTAFEIHVLPLGLPAFFNTNGVPRRLLNWKQLIPEWLKSKENNWPAFVVQTIFDDPRLQYENFSGAPNYHSVMPIDLQIQYLNGEASQFWLDLWLSDMYGLSGQMLLQLNCYDLACLVQIITTLGIDSTSQTARVKFLKPYGYLKKTKLIGRKEQTQKGKTDNPGDLCNNPFYGSPSRPSAMLCDVNDPTRSAFGNHMFAALEQNGETFVLDACAGPETGSTKLSDYCQKAIDTGADPNVDTGTTSNIIDGLGVGHLVISRAIERTGPPAQSLLIDKITQLPDTGTWFKPFFASPTGRNITTATYHLQPSWPGAQRELLTIHILKYAKGQEASNAYRRRTASLQQWLEETVEEGYSDETTGSVRMFVSPIKMYMVIIKATILKGDATKKLKGQLQTLLNQSLDPNPDSNFIANADTTPFPAVVGKTFEVTVKPTKVGAGAWRGFSVSNPTGQLANGEVKFTFLARFPGVENITLSMHDGNLKTQEKVVSVPCKAAP